MSLYGLFWHYHHWIDLPKLETIVFQPYSFYGKTVNPELGLFFTLQFKCSHPILFFMTSIAIPCSGWRNQTQFGGMLPMLSNRYVMDWWLFLLADVPKLKSKNILLPSDSFTNSDVYCGDCTYCSCNANAKGDWEFLVMQDLEKYVLHSDYFLLSFLLNSIILVSFGNKHLRINHFHSI